MGAKRKSRPSRRSGRAVAKAIGPARRGKKVDVYTLVFVDNAGRQVAHRSFLGTSVEAREALLKALPETMAGSGYVYGGYARRESSSD